MQLSINDDLAINHADENFTRFAGLTHPEVTGRALSAFIHAEDQANFNCQLKHCRKNGHTLTNILRLQDESGAFAWFSQTMVPKASHPATFCLMHHFLGYVSDEEKPSEPPASSHNQEALIVNGQSPHSVLYATDGWASMKTKAFKNADQLAEALVEPKDYPALQANLKKAIQQASPLEMPLKDRNWGNFYALQLIPFQPLNGEDNAFLVQKLPKTSSLSAGGIEQQALLTSHNPHPVIQVDAQGIIAFFNEAAQPLLDHWQAGLWDSLPQALLDNVPATPSANYIHFEVEAGQHIYEGMACRRDDHQCCFYLVDITQEKANQQKLAHQQQLLSSINQHIQEGIFRSTPTAGLIYVNEPFAKLFGYDSAEEILAAEASSLYADPQDRRNLIREEQAYGGLKNRPVKFCRKDGATFWGLLSSNRLLDEQGQVFYDGAVRDITQEIKVQKQLEEAKREAEELDRLKSHFLANMSHEVRTPLNGILGLVQLMEKEYTDDEQLTAYTQMIRESSERLLKTLNSIIAFSRLETGEVSQIMGATDPSHLLGNILRGYEQAASQRHLGFYNQVKAGLPSVAISPEVFQEVVQNLLDNALKFTHKGYIIIRAWLSFDQDAVLITIADTGVGIEPENRDRIFNAFYQESLGHSRAYEGPGLGLPIVKRFIQLCGGYLNLKSVKEKGTVFQLRLPLAKRHA